MFTQVEIINIGLAKIAAEAILRIDPPRSALERHCATGYPHWKRTELTKRRWVFAMVENYPMAQTDLLTDVERPYVYALPTECLRPVRTRRMEWRQAGRFLYSCYPSLTVTYIRNVDEAEFDPLFVEVLASRAALESVEYVTQSNTKKADVKALYEDALRDAQAANAFIIGPEGLTEDDENYPLVSSRY